MYECGGVGRKSLMAECLEHDACTSLYHRYMGCNINNTKKISTSIVTSKHTHKKGHNPLKYFFLLNIFNIMFMSLSDLRVSGLLYDIACDSNGRVENDIR